MPKMHTKSDPDQCFSPFFFSVLGLGHYSTRRHPPVQLSRTPVGSWQLRQKWLQQPRLCIHPASPPSCPHSSPHPCSSSSPPAYSSCHVPCPPEQSPPAKTAPPAGTPVRKVGQSRLFGSCACQSLGGGIMNITDNELYVRLVSGVAC